MRNLRKLFRGRRPKVKAPIQRTRLRRATADRPPVRLITIGPSDMIKHSLPLDTSNCWLLQYEGDGYKDWDRCWTEEGIRSLISAFRASYPEVKVIWLKKPKENRL